MGYVSRLHAFDCFNSVIDFLRISSLFSSSAVCCGETRRTDIFTWAMSHVCMSLTALTASLTFLGPLLQCSEEIIFLMCGDSLHIDFDSCVPDKPHFGTTQISSTCQ